MRARTAQYNRDRLGSAPARVSNRNHELFGRARGQFTVHYFKVLYFEFRACSPRLLKEGREIGNGDNPVARR